MRSRAPKSSPTSTPTTTSTSPARPRRGGGELELRVLPLENLRFTGNVSYARARTEDDKRYDNMPITKSNLTIDYTSALLGGLTSAVAVKWVYGFTYAAEVVPGDAASRELVDQRKRDTEGVVLIDANLTLPLDEHVDVYLQCSNLLGRAYAPYDPSGMVPRPGRAVFLGLRSNL